jgi:protease II
LPAIAQQQPATRRDDFRESFHGKDLVDPYHWLEASASPATRQWIGISGRALTRRTASSTFRHTLAPIPSSDMTP